jgi:hypothetical protein
METKELLNIIKCISRNGFKKPSEIKDNDIKILTENIKSNEPEIVKNIYRAIGQNH